MASTVDTGAPRFYTRKATGLVREVPLFDTILFNAAATTPLGASLAFGLFFALSAFPSSNILLDLFISIVLGIFVWVTFALLAATIPKVGGDYVFLSRILHPSIGLGSNLCVFFGSIFAAGAYATWTNTIGLVPAFQIIGTVTGSHGWLDLANALNQPTWTLIIGVATVVVLTVLSLAGTKVVLRTMTALYAIAFIGFAVSFVILLVTSHDSFVNALNNFSQPITHSGNTYQQTIDAGAKAGLTYPDRGGFDTRNTVGALFPAFGVILFCWWSVYLAAEMRGAGRRRRQLIAILGAGIGQGLLLLIAAAVFLNTIGYDFFAAAQAGTYKVSVSPYYNFFASIAAPGSVLAVFLGMVFMGWFLPGQYINLAMCHRAPFAWAFDGIVPRQLAYVSDRTHTPVVSILVTGLLAAGATAWGAYSKNFFTLLSASTLVTLVPFVLCGISAVVGMAVRPQIFRGSAADWRPWGIPIFPIAGALCALTALGGMVIACVFHDAIGFQLNLAIGLPVGLFLLGVVYYFIARAMQMRRGVNLDYVYQTIPPD